MKKKIVLLLIGLIIIQSINSFQISFQDHDRIKNKIHANASAEMNTRVLSPNNYIVENSSISSTINITQLHRTGSVTDGARLMDVQLWNATDTFVSNPVAPNHYLDSMEKYSVTAYYPNSAAFELQYGTEDMYWLKDTSTSTSAYLTLQHVNPASTGEFQWRQYILGMSSGTFGQIALMSTTGGGNFNLELRFVYASSTTYSVVWGTTGATIATISSVGWHHFRAVMLSTSVWDIYIDGVKVLYGGNGIGVHQPNYLYLGASSTTTASILIDAFDTSMNDPTYFFERNYYRECNTTFNNLYPGQYYYQTQLLLESGTYYYSPIHTLSIDITAQAINTQLVSESLHTTTWEFKTVQFEEDLSTGWVSNITNYFERTEYAERNYCWYNLTSGSAVYYWADIQRSAIDLVNIIEFADDPYLSHCVDANLTVYHREASGTINDAEISAVTTTNDIATLTYAQINALPFSICGQTGTSVGYATCQLSDFANMYMIAERSSYTTDGQIGQILSGYIPVLRTRYMKYNSSNPISILTNKNEIVNLSKTVSFSRNDILKISSSSSATLYINGTATAINPGITNWVADTDYTNTVVSIVASLTNAINFEIDSIERWSASNSYLNITLAPQSSSFSYVEPDYYGILVFEQDQLIEFNTIIINASNNILVYTTDDLTTVQITLFDAPYRSLVFSEYYIAVQYFKNQLLFSQTLLTNIIYVDEGTSINITIRDRQFNNLVYDATVTATEFLNIVCNVYSLRIRNNMATVSQITINSTYSNNLLVNEQIELTLPYGNYSLSYLNDAINPLIEIINISLNANYALQLNTTKNAVFFSIFGNDGFGFSDYTFRFFIDGTQRNLGYNIVNTNTHLLVMDYFNATVFNSTIYAGNISAYNIYASVYTLTLKHNNSESMNCKISRVGLTFNALDIWVGANNPVSYRFLANVRYSVDWYYANGTLGQSDIVYLTDNKPLSFGAHTLESPTLSKDDLETSFGYYMVIGLILLATCSALAIAVIVLFYQNKQKDNTFIVAAQAETKKRILREGERDDRYMVT